MRAETRWMSSTLPVEAATISEPVSGRKATPDFTGL